MSHQIKKLSAILVGKLSSPGHYGDGDGLWLQISDAGSKSWVFRFSMAGRAREMGLGGLNAVSLGVARERARQCRMLLSEGKDPIVERNAARTSNALRAARSKSFDQCAAAYISAHRGASVESTAAMVAHAAFDAGLGSGKFAFAGDRLSILDATDIIAAQTGKTFVRRSLGSEAALRTALAAAALDKANPFMAVMLAYQLYMLTGQTALDALHNGRYPDAALETFAQFAARTLPRAT